MRARITDSWAPPPLVVYPEKEEPGQSWLDNLETRLTSWATVLLLRIKNMRAAQFIDKVNGHNDEFVHLSDDMLLDAANELRRLLRHKEFEDTVVARSFALVREVAWRKVGLRHYECQLRGGYAMLHGMVAEMDTGEGKTLTATLAVATAALAGIPVHVVTVNDYLAKRDASQLEPIYHALGLRVGIITHEVQPDERRAVYNCDITYASNKEIAFDYLRDRLVLGTNSNNIMLKVHQLQGHHQVGDRLVMRGLHFAIVDEADSVLVDEARTPLIISRQTDAKDEAVWAESALALANALEPEADYRILKEDRRVKLTEEGIKRLKELGEELGGIWLSRIRREESTRQALSALYLFQRDDHYLVQDGKVQIIDEYSGRIMEDRSWSEGIHQLVELKEGCEVTGQKVPLARMTYQRFFRRYTRLAGMTGTAKEVANECWNVYRLPAVAIKPNKPSQRHRLPARIYPTMDDKWQAIVARTQELFQEGRPVMIGTRSVLASETLSAWLDKAGLEHVVLNASQDANEAEIIADAGNKGRIMVATNMAGRGVDIQLGPGISEIGGLYVILSERHDARRIDRQLEGRCGRQGDPGTTEAILSLEDPLLELIKGVGLLRFAGLIGRSGYLGRLFLFNRAQRRAERTHARARHELMNRDKKLGTLLAFSGEME